MCGVIKKQVSGTDFKNETQSFLFIVIISFSVIMFTGGLFLFSNAIPE